MLSLSLKGLLEERQLPQPAAAHRETNENRGVQLQQVQQLLLRRRWSPDLRCDQKGQEEGFGEDSHHVLGAVRLQPVQELGSCGHLRSEPRVPRGPVQRNVLQQGRPILAGGGQRQLHHVQRQRTGSLVHHVPLGQGHHEGGGVGQVLLLSESIPLLIILKNQTRVCVVSPDLFKINLH